MKNPYDTEDPKELQEIAFYWLYKANRYKEENAAMLDMFLQKGWNPSLKEINARRENYNVS